MLSGSCEAVGAVASRECINETVDDTTRTVPTLRIESERDENIVTFRQTHRRFLRGPIRQQLFRAETPAEPQIRRRSIHGDLNLPNRDGLSVQERNASAVCSRGTVKLTA